jgi:hypothetical protein
MLTIKNIEKLYKQSVGEWRVGRVETLDSSYLIKLMKPNGERKQVNIERHAIGEGDTALYELWFWSGSDKDPLHQSPVRRLLNKRDLNLGAAPLITLIDYMLKLK